MCGGGGGLLEAENRYVPTPGTIPGNIPQNPKMNSDRIKTELAHGDIIFTTKSF